MKIVKHELPLRSQILGMHLDRTTGKLLLGLGAPGAKHLLWTFDLDTKAFAPANADNVFGECMYIHRSIVEDDDGGLYVGATWVASQDAGSALQSTARQDVPVEGAFLKWLVSVGALDNMAATHGRVAKRAADGTWTPVGSCPGLGSDLAWDSRHQRLLRLSPRGIGLATGSSPTALCRFPGFNHELAVSASGQVLLCDTEGMVSLHGGKGLDDVRPVGVLDDHHEGPNQATPGIDACVYLQEHDCFVGGSRNLARLFMVDVGAERLTPFAASSYQPRLTAIAPTSAGDVYFSHGVGSVALSRLDLATRTSTFVAEIRDADVHCHHLHAMVSVGANRLFGGESFPLDVFDPPRPARAAYLWEIDLG